MYIFSYFIIIIDVLQQFELIQEDNKRKSKKSIDDVLLLPNTILNVFKFTKHHSYGINQVIDDIKSLCDLSLSNLSLYHFDIHYKSISTMSVKSNPLWCLYRIFIFLLNNGLARNISEDVKSFVYFMELEKMIKDLPKTNVDEIVKKHDNLVQNLKEILKSIKKDENLFNHRDRRYNNLSNIIINQIDRNISNLNKYDYYLNINQTYCGDDGMKYICKYYNEFTNLVYLSLYGNSITSNGIKYLTSMLCFMPKLTNLNLESILFVFYVNR